MGRAARRGRAPLGQGVVLLGVLAAAVAQRQRKQLDARADARSVAVGDVVDGDAVDTAAIDAATVDGLADAREEFFVEIGAPVLEELTVPKPSVMARLHELNDKFELSHARLGIVTGFLIASSVFSALGIMVHRADHFQRVFAASPIAGGVPRMVVAEARDDIVTSAPAVAPSPPPPPPATKPAPARVPRPVQQRVSRGAPRSVLPGMWPVSGPITGAFMEGRGGHRHPGIDISAPTGTPIVAPVAGTVVFAGPASTAYSGYGNLVVIDHGNGDFALYAHMSRVIAHVGDQVTPGVIIGLVGSTGHATGPHLHFEVRRGGGVIDPAAWLVSRQQQ